MIRQSVLQKLEKQKAKLDVDQEKEEVNSNKVKVGPLTFPKKLCYLLHWKPFKNDEKCLLFHLKSSFRSQDI